MKNRKQSLHAIARAAALLLLAGSAHSQQTTLKPVTITGQAFPPAADVTGFGDVPLREVPISATVIDSRLIEQSGSRRLADLTRFDPSLTDAYDAPGYWDMVSVRGYLLDNDYNYRREGLPINAETTVPLENKERVEILKGTSGMQAGISAPGGLVNYVVKRPTDTDLRSVRLEFTQRASFLAAADLGGRFGTDGAFGYRVNVAQEQLRPMIRSLDGRRSLFAFAGDWRLPNDGLFEGEIEWSRKTQPSQVGFSLLGPVLPGVPDPRANLNNQPWLQPSKFDALTGTLRYSQPLGRDWRVALTAGTQRLKNDDYTAFPFGCSSEGNFDRFCSDGTFDFYDYRSIGERRRQDALSLDLKGKLTTGGVGHDLAFGVLRSTARERLPDYAYNFVGVGDISGNAVVPPDPTPVYPGTRRDEHTTEFSARDRIQWSDRFSTWLGVRHTRLDRSSIEGDAGSLGYRQSITAPWAALVYKLTPDAMVYTSWGEGVESAVVPSNAAVFTNAGAVLPALKSRQAEVGMKGARARWAWQVDAFDIRRPMTNFDACGGIDCTGRIDGTAHHRGVEAALSWTGEAWRVGATAMLLRARREGTVDSPELDGKRPANVPSVVARAFAAWKVPAVNGLELQGWAVHEGNRAVLADNSIMLPAWTRFDAALRYETQLRGATTSWTLGIDNVTGKRYWRESPFQFAHVYLYPGAPRTARVTFTAAM
jgi:iron complex outermembrane receptor protein